MTLARLLRLTGAVLPRTVAGADAHGNDIVSFGPPTPAPYWAEPLTGAEVTLDQNLQIGDARLYLSASTALSGVDRWSMADGTVWEVIGPPLFFPTPRGPHHLEAIVRRYVG